MKRLLLRLVLVLAFASSASAVSFGFDCIAGASLACGVGEASLSVNVIDSGSGTVTLTFSNSDAGTSSVTGIYLDGSRPIAKASNSGGAGTSFKKGGKPKDLPGGGNVSFHDDFRFTAKKPQPLNGINGGESLTIELRLKNGVTYADVIAALGDGSLRLGLLISDADPNCVGDRMGSECVGDPGVASFVNLPNPVPEPIPAILGGVACFGLALIGRRRH